MFVYADNAATTRLSETALAAMLPCLREQYGNPSSLHAAGQAASGVLVRARETMARLLGCAPHELVFTSGGSESDNQALLSAAALGAAQGRRHIVSTAFEHHAVLHTLNRLRARGFDVTLLPVHDDGVVTAADIAAALRPDTCLVSVMYANNEIGTIQPADEIGALCRARGVLFHTDAVQAAGHLPIDLAAQPIDLLSLSAHKFHGPKGVGLLYVRRGVQLTPLIDGGAQERGLRAGTENVPGIAAMAAAFEESCTHMTESACRVSALRDRLTAGLSQIPGALLNGGAAHRLPGIMNFCFEGVDGETLLLLLDQAGICVSTGSACAAGSVDPSHVLLALGRTRAQAHSSIRLSLSDETTDAEVDYLLETVPACIARLRG